MIILNLLPCIRIVNAGQEERGWITLIEYAQRLLKRMFTIAWLAEYITEGSFIDVLLFVTISALDVGFVYFQYRFLCLYSHSFEILKISKEDWSIGQIVTVTVLLPPVFEYINLTIHK